MSKETSLALNCYQFFFFTWFDGDCKPCQASPGGGSFLCGESAARDTSVAFETVMKLYFVKQGSIEFYYTKDSTQESDGWVSGLFSFYIDETVVLEDDNVNDNPDEWKYFKYDVYPGMKELTFLYQKYNSDQNAKMAFEIKSLRITGTEYSDLTCKKCELGFS